MPVMQMKQPAKASAARMKVLHQTLLTPAVAVKPSISTAKPTTVPTTSTVNVPPLPSMYQEAMQSAAVIQNVIPLNVNADE